MNGAAKAFAAVSLVTPTAALAIPTHVADLTLPTLAIDMSAGLEPEPPKSETAGTTPSDAAKPARPTYGHAKAQTWSIGGMYASDFQDSNDFNLHVAYSNFLADDLEFAVEAAGWYFDQPGEDTGGVSGSMVFRWHFWHTCDYDWSVFLEGGIGLLGAFDSVPDGGTSFNFLPRAGAGFTKALGDKADSPRLMVAVRWHHVSNARIFGDEHNPSRDAIAVDFAVVFPF